MFIFLRFPGECNPFPTLDFNIHLEGHCFGEDMQSN